MPSSQFENPKLNEADIRTSIQLGNASEDDSEEENSGSMRIFASKDNTSYKWQRARGVIGALEIESEPILKVRENLVPHTIKGKGIIFQDAMEAWKTLKLREDLIKAVDKLPDEMCCCGLLVDEVATKRRFVKLLNDRWAKAANKKLLGSNKGMKVDVFLWNWQNASGKAESNILLIRFFELSSYRFRMASSEASIDFDLIDEKDAEVEMAAPQKEDMNR